MSDKDGGRRRSKRREDVGNLRSSRRRVKCQIKCDEGMRSKTSFSGVKNEMRERVKGRMRAGGWDDYKLVLWLQAPVAGQQSRARCQVAR